MKRTLSALALASATTLLVASASLAANVKETLALHTPTSVHNLMLKHAMGSVKVTYLPHDLEIKLTADGLPKPSAIHEKTYVVFLTSGGKVMHLGKLNYHATGMSTYTGMPMVTKFTAISVWAQQSATDMHPMGIKVLSANSMHH